MSRGVPRCAPTSGIFTPMRADTPAVLMVMLLGLACAACSPAPEPTAPESEAVREGRKIFRVDACPTCHGQDRTGTNNGPSLEELHQRWKEDDLIHFLRDPSAARRTDPRLRQLAERYKTSMPSPARTDEARLKLLASYLLQE
jgi:mono/diheme cytochrome c family protein